MISSVVLGGLMTPLQEIPMQKTKMKEPGAGAGHLKALMEVHGIS